jgi:hypothetical protein
MSKVTDAEHQTALANLYPDAAARVDALWSRGRLESRAGRPHSSQALCVSVLETIASRAPHTRAALIQAIAAEAGLTVPVGHAVEVAAEVREHREVLGETGAGMPTSLDGLVHWSGGVLTIESKFCEVEFGACGQIKTAIVKPPDPRAKGRAAGRAAANCTGRHEVGSDTKPSTADLKAECRLTIADGRRAPRRYWEVAPYLFLPEILTTPRKCPFASDAFQLMRNVGFAHEWPRPPTGGWFGTLICLVDRSPHAADLRERVTRFRALLRPEFRTRVGMVSYERIADVLSAHGEAKLGAWVCQRIADVAASRNW